MKKITAMTAMTAMTAEKANEINQLSSTRVKRNSRKATNKEGNLLLSATYWMNRNRNRKGYGTQL